MWPPLERRGEMRTYTMILQAAKNHRQCEMNDMNDDLPNDDNLVQENSGDALRLRSFSPQRSFDEVVARSSRRSERTKLT